MKNNLLLTLCLASFTLFAQRSPQADSVGVMASPNQGNQTRALVIGISKYQDSVGITNLQFANRDAEIFADYLKSPAGGGLPPENVWLMTNQAATLGAIDNGLNWLIKESKKGDKVVIYYSGHGDVENQTLWQRGFLLAHGTPAHLYRNNAVRVEDLDEIIKTLSIGNEAKVIVILDACRSGNLAKAGPSLTAEQLQKQAENEVRILSCKPDQKSLEGELWGGGRGLFSYYLINGLKGLANQGSFLDNTVSFDELEDFVKKHMAESISDNNLTERQNPVFIGDENFELAEVNSEALEEATHEMGLVMASAPVGLGDKGVSAKSPVPNISASKDDALIQFIQLADLDSLAADPAFAVAVEENDPKLLLHFFTERLRVANAQKQLSVEAQALFPSFSAASKQSKTDDKLRQQLQELLAARLHDQVQDVINAYLRGDAKELDKRRYIDQAEKYVQYPLMLQAAMQLLPKSHLLYDQVAVKYYYFDGVCTRLASQMSDAPMSRIPEALEKQRKALALDDKAPYIYNEMGLLQTALAHLDSALYYFEKAAELAPSWALPKANLIALYNHLGQTDKAYKMGEAAIALQPDYFGIYVNLGTVAEKERDLIRAETYYRKARSLNDPHYLPYQHLAEVQLETARYAAANWNFHEMELRKKGTVSDVLEHTVVMFPALASPSSRGYPELSGPGVIYPNPKTAQEFFMTGKAYYEKQRYQDAEPNFKQAMRLMPNHLEVYYYLGDICLYSHRYEEAEVYFKRLIPLRPEVDFMPLFLADVYRAWQRPQEEEAIYRDLIANKKALNDAYEYLHWLLHGQKRYSEEELLFWEGLNKAGLGYWAKKGLVGFYSSMMENYPNDANWLFRKATFDYEYSSHSYGVLEYEQVIALDSNFAARPFMHVMAGAYYLQEGDKKLFRELNKDWEGDLPKAITHLRQAARLAPQLPSAKYHLAEACEKLYQYDEALSVLEALRDSNDLNFDSRLQLADLYTRSGRSEEAVELLDKALDIQPESVDGLPACIGSWQMMQGDTANAIAYYLEEYNLAIAKGDTSSVKLELLNGMRSGDAEDYDIATSTAYTLARLYASLGNKAEAMKWLETAFTRGFDSKLVVKYDPAWNRMWKDAMFEKLLTEHSMN